MTPVVKLRRQFEDWRGRSEDSRHGWLAGDKAEIE
jgi:hypothetical protein